MSGNPKETPEDHEISVKSETYQSVPLFRDGPTLSADGMELYHAGKEEGIVSHVCVVLTNSGFHMSRALDSNEARIMGKSLIAFADRCDGQATTAAEKLLDQVFKPSSNRGEGHGG